MISLYLLLLTVIILFMTVWFIVALVSKRNDVADIAWGLGFIVSALFLFFFNHPNGNFLFVLALTSLWGLRLSTHIFLRFIKRKEDSRYVEMKKDWGKFFVIRTYLQVFLLQGFLMSLISFSALITSHYPAPINILSWIGALIWLNGFFFESVGDYQLTQFLKDPQNKGKLMTSGLWSLSRHPNYFGEVSQWWGIFIIALSSAYGWLAIVSPLTITFMILKVSGIPLLEKKYEGRADFAAYKSKTSAFFPWFPRKS